MERGLGWREKLRSVIFDADTPAGFAFDLALLVAIIFSIVVVMLESVIALRASHGPLLQRFEWFFTLLFTAEFLVRILALKRPMTYIRSFWGIIDFLSVVPTYLALVFPEAAGLLIIRSFRLLRVFRLLHLSFFVDELRLLVLAIRASSAKLVVFLLCILIIISCVGTLMYWVEGPANGFTSIPRSVYWAIVTLTTVGFGDIVPRTPLGQFLSAVIMILGYSVIAVPSGLVTVELASRSKNHAVNVTCPVCTEANHDRFAAYCHSCGYHLAEVRQPET